MRGGSPDLCFYSNDQWLFCDDFKTNPIVIPDLTLKFKSNFGSIYRNVKSERDFISVQCSTDLKGFRKLFLPGPCLHLWTELLVLVSEEALILRGHPLLVLVVRLQLPVTINYNNLKISTFRIRSIKSSRKGSIETFLIRSASIISVSLISASLSCSVTSSCLVSVLKIQLSFQRWYADRSIVLINGLFRCC